MDSPRNIPIRLAEIIGALSIATDLGNGQPLEFALRGCILAMRLGEALGYSDEALREVYYQSLLRYIGCNVETHLLASVVGDEFALRADFAQIDNGSAAEVVGLMVRYMRRANSAAAPMEWIRAMARGLITLPKVRASFAAHCEVAQRLAERLGFDSAVVYALGQLYERWDGKGLPNGLKGEAVAPAVLVVTLAQDALLFRDLSGVDAALNVARERKGSAYAPKVVECFCDHAEGLFRGLDDEPSWDAVLALEPGARKSLSAAEFDTACRVMADFVDIKASWSLDHSPHVAELAAAATQNAGLPAADVALVRRAGWLHDIGKTGVLSHILEKPGTLSEREWEVVRLHPYYAERITAHSPALAQIGVVAARHHERMDTSGYHRGLPGTMLTPAARILAAANAYRSLVEDRPYRAARSPEDAAAAIKAQVHAGKLDGDAVGAVLSTAGHAVPHADVVAGLSEREIEVLRLLAKGSLTKEIAAALSISPKTADHHIQHIYDKIGVSTRAGAALFAAEHHLLG